MTKGKHAAATTATLRDELSAALETNRDLARKVAALEREVGTLTEWKKATEAGAQPAVEAERRRADAAVDRARTAASDEAAKWEARAEAAMPYIERLMIAYPKDRGAILRDDMIVMSDLFGTAFGEALAAVAGVPFTSTMAKNTESLKRMRIISQLIPDGPDKRSLSTLTKAVLRERALGNAAQALADDQSAHEV